MVSANQQSAIVIKGFSASANDAVSDANGHLMAERAAMFPPLLRDLVKFAILDKLIVAVQLAQNDDRQLGSINFLPRLDFL